jgi:hypothetical protein
VNFRKQHRIKANEAEYTKEHFVMSLSIGNAYYKKEGCFDMRLKAFFALTLLTLLIGCASSPQSHTPRLEPLEQKKTALVITKGSYFHKNLIGLDEHPITYELARVDTDSPISQERFFYRSQVTLVKQLKSAVSVEQNYDVFMVKPGTYLLENMTAELGNTIIHARSPWGVFTVNPGEVLYIGDFQFKFDKGGKTYEVVVTDNREKAEKYFKQHYPEYKLMETRLLRKATSMHKQ